MKIFDTYKNVYFRFTGVRIKTMDCSNYKEVILNNFDGMAFSDLLLLASDKEYLLEKLTEFELDWDTFESKCPNFHQDIFDIYEKNSQSSPLDQARAQGFTYDRLRDDIKEKELSIRSM